MGYYQDFPEKQRPVYRRYPSTIGGHVYQRSFLMILVGFFAIYTCVEYLSTRNVLARCAESDTVEVSIAAAPPPPPAYTADLSIETTEPIQNQVHEERITVQDSASQETAEDRVQAVTKSPTIAKVTMMYGPHAKDETMKLIIEGHRQHAARHGHGIHILDRQLLHGLWSKHAWLMMVMLEEMQKPEDMRTKWLA